MSGPQKILMPAVVLLGFFAANLQLWAVDFPPLVDWPNHLARHAIQCKDPNYGSLAAFYDFRLRLVPNLAGDLVYALQIACRDIFFTQKLLIQFATTGLILSAFALHFAIWRQFSLWPALAAFAVHNMNFGYGFENFVLAAPFGIAMLAGWIFMADARAWMRALVFVPLGFGLYVAHLYVFFFFGCMIFAFEIGRAMRGDARAAVSYLLPVVLVGLPPGLHFVWSLISAQTPSVTETVYGSLLAKSFNLLSITSPLGYYTLDWSSKIHSLLTAIFIIAVPFVLRSLHVTIGFDPRFRIAALVCVFILIAMPAQLASVYFSDVRFPFLILIVMICASNVTLTWHQQVFFAVLLVCAFSLRVHLIRQDWMVYQTELIELLEATQDLNATSRLLMARDGADARLLRHTHSSAYIGMMTGAFVPTLFNGANPLQPHVTVRGRTVTQGSAVAVEALIADKAGQGQAGYYWRDWHAFYTHVILIQTTGNAEFPALGQLMHRGSFFDIYRVTRTEN